MRFCLQACTSVSSKNKTTKIIDLFIKVDHIAMQYKQISLFCSFPDPAKKNKASSKSKYCIYFSELLETFFSISSLNQSDWSNLFVRLRVMCNREELRRKNTLSVTTVVYFICTVNDDIFKLASVWQFANRNYFAIGFDLPEPSLLLVYQTENFWIFLFEKTIPKTCLT